MNVYIQSLSFGVIFLELFNQHIVYPKQLIFNYAKIGMNETELVIVLQLIYHMQSSSEMPSFETLSKSTTLSEQQVAQAIQGLIQKDLLTVIVNHQAPPYGETFSLSHIEERLMEEDKQESIYEETKQLNFNELFERFEVQFGRPLTPIEMQTLTQWMDTDHHSPALINAALDEAAAHNKFSFKYIDRILLNWKKRNVQTIDDSKKVSNQYKTSKQLTKTIQSFPVFDWVNGENPYDK